jgi:hypothetical protein
MLHLNPKNSMQKIKLKTPEEKFAETLLPALIELKKKIKKSEKTKDVTEPILTQDMIELILQQRLS